jgi:dCMP deaminase
MLTKWDKRFLKFAYETSTWSKDPSTQIGSVIIEPNKRIILSQGYNGFPRGISDNTDRLINREEKYKYTIHAEMNSIYNASFSGVCLDGAHLYVHGLPVCSKCALGVIQVGIKRVVMYIPSIIKNQTWIDEWEISKELFNEAGIEFIMEKNDESIKTS